jgi:hypothetical protein
MKNSKKSILFFSVLTLSAFAADQYIDSDFNALVADRLAAYSNPPVDGQGDSRGYHDTISKYLNNLLESDVKAIEILKDPDSCVNKFIAKRGITFDAKILETNSAAVLKARSILLKTDRAKLVDVLEKIGKRDPTIPSSLLATLPGVESAHAKDSLSLATDLVRSYKSGIVTEPANTSLEYDVLNDGYLASINSAIGQINGGDRSVVIVRKSADGSIVEKTTLSIGDNKENILSALSALSYCVENSMAHDPELMPVGLKTLIDPNTSTLLPYEPGTNHIDLIAISKINAALDMVSEVKMICLPAKELQPANDSKKHGDAPVEKN